MDRILFADFTVRDVLLWVGLAVAVWLVISLLRRMLRPRRESAHHQRVRCPGCGWVGQVSRHAGRCPKCNRPLGEQRARGAGG